MSKRFQLVLIGLVCFLLGCLVAPHIPGLRAQGETASKKPQWTHGLELKCRKAGQEDFDKAETFGIEVFKDTNNGNLIYISQTGSIAVVPAK